MQTLQVEWTGDIPGYGAARVDGRFAVSIPTAGVLTDAGLLPLPGGQPAIYLALPSQGTAIAGLGHRDGHAYEWVGAWADRGPAYGPNAVIYDAESQLHIVQDVGEYQASGGYRGVIDGQLVPVSSTYADPGRGLWEYLDYGDVAIGQGAFDDDGVVVRFAREVDAAGRPVTPILRQLLAGDAHNIRVDRVGDRVAIAAVFYRQHVTRLWWGSLAELRALPPLVIVPIPPPQPPLPPESPDPKEPPVSIPLPEEIRQIVRRFAAVVPVPSGGLNPADDRFEQACRVWTYQVAQQVSFSTGDARWGVKRADETRPQSKDAIANDGGLLAGRLIGFDLLTGVGTGSPSLVEHPQGEDITGQVFMRALPAKDYLGGADAPRPPTPEPVPTPGPDLAGLLNALEALTTRLGSLEAMVASLQMAVGTLQTQPSPRLRLVPAPDPRDPDRVVISTSRTAMHAHELALKVEAVR